MRFVVVDEVGHVSDEMWDRLLDMTEFADVRLYAEGIGAASACVPADQPDDITLRYLNRVRHPGTTHGWRLSDDPTFATDQPNPCRCDEDPRRKHLLLVC